jgi:hypothetical protein
MNAPIDPTTEATGGRTLTGGPEMELLAARIHRRKSARLARVGAASCGLLIALSLALSPHSAAAAGGQGSLGAGQWMNADGQTLQSPGGQFNLVFQSDGNLVLYDPLWKPLWASNTANEGAFRAWMQTDGNFVIYNHAWRPLWATSWLIRQATVPNSVLQLQSDANLVLYAPDGRAIWATYVLSHTVTSPLNCFSDKNGAGAMLYQVCLATTDWQDGRGAGTVSVATSYCTSTWWLGFICSKQSAVSMGSYWRASINANDDWATYQIRVVGFSDICAHLDIFTPPAGRPTFGSSWWYSNALTPC